MHPRYWQASLLNDCVIIISVIACLSGKKQSLSKNNDDYHHHYGNFCCLIGKNDKVRTWESLRCRKSPDIQQSNSPGIASSTKFGLTTYLSIESIAQTPLYLQKKLLPWFSIKLPLFAWFFCHFILFLLLLNFLCFLVHLSHSSQIYTLHKNIVCNYRWNHKSNNNTISNLFVFFCYFFSWIKIVFVYLFTLATSWLMYVCVCIEFTLCCTIKIKYTGEMDAINESEKAAYYVYLFTDIKWSIGGQNDWDSSGWWIKIDVEDGWLAVWMDGRQNHIKYRRLDIVILWSPWSSIWS